MIHKGDHIYKRINKELLSLKSKSLVIDVGTAHRYSKEAKLFKPVLNKLTYKALGYKPDMKYGKNNCDYDGDIHDLQFKSGTIDSILCFEVLEHVSNPAKAVSELHRVTKTGGLVILTTPFLTSYHGRSQDLGNFSHEGYPDFWRFTHQGLEHLFKDFSKVEVLPFSNTLSFFINLLLPGKSSRLQQWLNSLIPPRKGNTTYRHLVVAYK